MEISDGPAYAGNADQGKLFPSYLDDVVGKSGAGGGMCPAVLPPLNPRPLDGDGISSPAPWAARPPRPSVCVPLYL